MTKYTTKCFKEDLSFRTLCVLQASVSKLHE